MSIFERYNFKIVGTDLVLGDYFQQEHESDELLNNDTAEDNHYLNVFVCLMTIFFSSLFRLRAT